MPESSSSTWTTPATRSTTSPHPPFDHAVTVLDLLFSVGKEAPLYMKSFATRQAPV